MDKHNVPRFVVIGAGHIGTYMRVCYERAAGGRLRGRVLLNKATSRGLGALKEAFDCEITVGNPLGALRQMEPDVVLVCPPPDQVASVTEEALAPYCRERREKGLPLPAILSFAPTPGADFFYDRLGEGIRAVKILPNMFRSVGGLPSADLDYNFISFSPSRPWAEKDRAWLYDFLAPLGRTVEVAENHSLPLLGLRIAAHCYYDMCFLFGDALASRGLPGGHRQAAGVMRSALRRVWDDFPPEVIPCSAGDLDPHSAQFVGECAAAWLSGLLDFIPEAGLPAQAGHLLRSGRAEAYLVSVSLLSREEAERMTSQLSTKGGVCECATRFFRQSCREELDHAFGTWLDLQPLPDGWWNHWRALGCQAARTVARHSETLAGF